MNRYALLIEYSGTGYQGFQRQQPYPAEQATRRARSVQEELENKLSLMLNEEVRLTAAGRTDTGVHATAQVISFTTTRERSPAELVRGANGLLDPRVRVRSAALVDEDFRPRFRAEWRTYHYYLLPGREAADPFLAQLVWSFPAQLDLEAMTRAAQPLLGGHDFAAYGRGVTAGEPTRRDMQRIAITRCGQLVFAPGPFRRLEQLVCVEVQANAFLRRMVRQLVANLVKVGLGQWPESRPGEILHSLDPALGAAPVPPHGLYLVEVAYAGCRLPAWNQLG